jgi:competence protein ComEC
MPAAGAGALGGLLLATLYALFSGWGVPAQRTIWMLAVVILLRQSGRQWPWAQTWLLAMAVVVAIDPWALMQAGFWLSFVAVGVLFATDSGASGTRGAEEAGTLAAASAALAGRLGSRRARAMGGHAGAHALVAAAVQPGLAGRPAGQRRGHSLGDPGSHAARPGWACCGRRPVARRQAVQSCWRCCCSGWQAGLSPPGGRAAAVGAVAGVAGGVLAGHAPALDWRALGIPLLLPVLLWQAPRPRPGSSSCWRPTSGRATRCWCARHATAWSTTPAPFYSRETDAGQRVLVPLLRALGRAGGRPHAEPPRHRPHRRGGRGAGDAAAGPGSSARLKTRHPLQAAQGGTLHGRPAWEWDGVRFEVLHPGAEAYGAAANPMP